MMTTKDLFERADNIATTAYKVKNKIALKTSIILLAQDYARHTPLELLELKLKEATEAVVPSDDEAGLMEKESEIAYLNHVIEFIKDLQPIA